MDKIKWRELLQAVDTLVILMGLHNLREIMHRLIAEGCESDKPVALVESGTYLSQKKLDGTVHTICDLAESWNFRSPTIIVIGEVVRLAKHLEWFHEAACGYPISALEETQECAGPQT